jgi:acetylornithine deacetylase/succinyl-diaminopimelate desuccinylase-like protein
MNAPGAPTALATPAITRPEDLVGYDLIRRLVGFPTVSRDSNLALIEWIRAYVEELGATTALTFNDDRRKANLFVTFAARGRQCDARRHRPVRAYGRGAGRRPAVGHRSVRP